jgi:hypothetical protein
MCEEVFSKPGGLNLSRRDLDRENLDTFKKLVSILSRHHLPVQKVSIEIEKSVET